MFVDCPIAQVVNVNIRDSFFLGAFHDTLAQRRTTDLRKQRDDIDLHWENVERSPLNVQHRIVGRLTRSLPLSRPDGLPVYVARVPASPFCELRKLSELAQTPHNLSASKTK